ncbi:PREDICTED: polyadenylate-binding protein-interacting protein 1 isoform X1 [Polistes canadensis]|uniref:polyadenylate-binding protein-interacting protein 1 isoform X1 n=1 Tax=Polistes canadensis TaxID=91411 RepID=UPI000718B1B5|nr:PREDICTED: polyadenylate-binding protein-interacting protein 1 isoform X1 [Polistes canadensis]XP_014614489.1 PREDICTED: polyadenylate-binding protein-interacting protein 1 isoform X1 [Polistes canadensis]
MNRFGEDESGNSYMDRRSNGRGRGRGSWAPIPKSTQERQTLRRPHFTGNTHPAVGGSTLTTYPEQNRSQEFMNRIVENSTLSVHAAEFVPKCQSYVVPMQQQSSMMWPKHSVQNRIQLARELPHQMQHQLPGQTHLQQRQMIDRQHYDHYSESSYSSRQRQLEDPEIRRVQELRLDNQELNLANTMQQLGSVMHYLTMNPGSFASLVPPLLNNIKLYCESPTQLQEIMDVVIVQSITEGNFRYSGARIFMCLDTAMTREQQKPFREILHLLCKEKTQKYAATWQKNDKHTEEEQIKCHGFILFLAELVVQMGDVLAFELGEILIQLISIVLKNPGSNSAKHICQALKLAGHTLERDKRGRRKEMENMMRTLTQLVTEGRADTSVSRMIDSVHQLRNGNWGRESHNASSQNSISEPIHPPKIQHEYNELVLYGPDGKVLSAEESQFLQDAATDASDSEKQEELDHELEELLDDEEDESFETAYEEFLKLLPKNIENKIHQ